MKSITLRVASVATLICILLAAPLAALAQLDPPCANDSPCGQTGPLDCPLFPSEGNGLANPVVMYTGNVIRPVNDLLVSGSVGDYPLRWRRTMTTRYRTTMPASLGDGGSWRHSYQWGIIAGTKNNIISFTVNYPDGSEIEFRKNSAADTFWRSYDAASGVTPPPASGVPDRVGPGVDADHYILYRQDGGQVFFSKAGSVWRADKIRDPHGLDTLLAYGTVPTELILVTEPAGRTLQVTWFTWTQTKPNGQPYSERLISRVDSSDAQSVVYTYAAYTSPAPESFVYSTLVTADYGDGTAAHYTYRASNRSDGHGRPLPLSCDDPRYTDGPLSRVQYDYTISDDVYGLIHSEKSLSTGTVIATYTMNGSQRTEQTGDGRSRTLTYDRFRLIIALNFSGKPTTYTYNSSNFIATRTDALNHTTTFEREPQIGALTKVTYPDGTFRRMVYSDPAAPYFVAEHYDELNRKIAFTRDARNNVTRVDYPDGAYEIWTYNTFNQPLTHRQRNSGTESFVYDTRGLLSSWTDALGKITAFTYDTHDRLASVTDPLNHGTGYQHNLRGLLTKKTFADGNFVAFTYDAYGNTLTYTNELNHVWTGTYDEYNRMATATDPLNRTTSYSYGLVGGTGCGSCHDDALPTRITLPSNKYTTFAYDADRRRTAMTVGADTPAAATTSYTYDDVGNLLTLTDGRGKTATFAYDSRNRRLSATDPLSHATLWTYDNVGNPLTEKRADNTVIAYAYDAMNRRTQVTDPLNQITKMAFDGAGNLSTLTDPRNNTHTFTYDLRNRRTRLSYPGGSHEDWSYDDAGRPIAYTARGGQVRTFTYDSRNRPIDALWSDGITPEVTASYDVAGRVLTLNNVNSALSYAYDAAGQLSSETQNVASPDFSPGPGPKTVSYTYDADGNRVSLTNPGGSVVTYTYTTRNQPAAVFLNGPPPLAEYTYDLAGNRAAKTLENGTTVTYTYDNAGRLTSLAHQAGGTALASFAYAYNAVDNRTSVTRENALGDAYAYDAAEQLTGVQYNAANPAGTPANPLTTQTYAYDAAGNRTNLVQGGTTTTYTADALNAYTQVGAAVPNYDANGNLIYFDGQSFTFDAQNRLTSAGFAVGSASATEEGDGVDAVGAAGRALKCKPRPPVVLPNTLSTRYDARNRPVWRSANGNTRFLYYDGWSLVAEYGINGGEVAGYVHGARLDEVIARVDGASGALAYYHADGLGSTALLTDANGQIVERYSYDVYGQPTIQSAAGATLAASAQGNRFLFTGREWLAEIGIYDYRHRVYSPRLGRFLQTDPIGYAGGVNLYDYCANNPARFIDSTGLSWGTATDGGFDQLKRITNPKPPPWWHMLWPGFMAYDGAVGVGEISFDLSSTIYEQWTGGDYWSKDRIPGDELDRRAGAASITVLINGLLAFTGEAILGGVCVEATEAGLGKTTSPEYTYYHYTQETLPKGEGLKVGSGVTQEGGFTGQEAMLNLGIDPPAYVYPVSLADPMEHLTIDIGTPRRNTLPSWTVIKQTPPGSVGQPRTVPRGK